MKENKYIGKIVIAVLIIIAIGYYWVNKQSQTPLVKETLTCEELLSKKYDRYFQKDLVGSWTQPRVIYNKDLKTCLVLNSYTDNNRETLKLDFYEWKVIDMLSDKELIKFEAFYDSNKSYVSKDEKMINCGFVHEILLYLEDGSTVKEDGCGLSGLETKGLEKAKNLGLSLD